VNTAKKIAVTPLQGPEIATMLPKHSLHLVKLAQVSDESALGGMIGNMRDLFRSEKLPPLKLTSSSVPVKDPFAIERDPVSSAISVGVHIVVISLIGWFLYTANRHHIEVQKPAVVTAIEMPTFIPVAPKPAAMGGGGGGGSHDILQTPKGHLPKIEKDPITPPVVLQNINPKLAVEPAVNVPKDIAVTNNNLPDLGDTKSAVIGPQSNGIGAGGGMGSGRSGGIGAGTGNGLGLGTSGGMGGGLYHVGSGVAAPLLIHSVDPEFTDEARRVRFQGVSSLQIVVDAQGNVQRAKVLHPIGMGLDQKAIEAVKQYKFKPAMLQGRAVPVEVNIEISFHLM
jgi:protein TonB